MALHTENEPMGLFSAWNVIRVIVVVTALHVGHIDQKLLACLASYVQVLDEIL